ncbi:MAG: hypothetical protein PHV68_07850, partial [Candidatus Gastranaerophilales bacterium]|nr:hypothetical protein [Candidatus Gastranaerophilales bacterium]
TVFLTIFAAYEYFKKNKNKNNLIFLVLSAIALLISTKTFFFLSLHVYGTFAFVLLITVFSIFWTEKLPEYFKKIDKQIWQKTFAIVIIFIGILFIIKEIPYANNRNFAIKTSRGTIYADKENGFIYKKILDYINTNIPESSTILVLPEGAMFNFLTNKASMDKYHSLLPLYVEMYGEQNIINDLLKNSPDYIFINNRNTAEYGYTYFCKDYGQNICNFIYKNYKIEKNFQTSFQNASFKLVIYKKLLQTNEKPVKKMK